MIDQFVVSGESKWNLHNGLVMLLPHGFDGAGPEHSSSRVERFLQLSDTHDKPVLDLDFDIYQECNVQIVNCTTAAQYFHVLRRQMLRPFRKPLIVVAPKKLLKLREAGSDIEEFHEGKCFLRISPENNTTIVPSKVRKVLFCSGQVYYDLIAEREKLQKTDIAIIRLEQLAPFPFKNMLEEIKRYPNAEFTWCQEEHKNAGGW